MKLKIDKNFILITDRELISLNVPLHARPFNVAIKWMQTKNISMNVFEPEIWEPLMLIYKEQYPSGNFSFPNMQIGCVGFRDRAYLAKVNIGFGLFQIEPLKCIDISNKELDVIWEQEPRKVWQAVYSVADLWDFTYGISDLGGQNNDADQLWSNAQSAIDCSAHTLFSGHHIDSSIQSACLASELAMKGALAFLGWQEKERRSLNHNLPKLAEAIISCRPTKADNRLRMACSSFPDYVKTRYENHGLTKVQLIELAMRSQFIAAEVLRRISKRNLAGEIETEASSPIREQCLI